MLDIFDELTKLGLINKNENGIDKIDQALLLKLYFAKIKGEVDVDKIINDLKGNVKIDANTLKQIEDMHNVLMQEKKDGLAKEEKLGECRAFENYENKFHDRCKIFEQKKQDFDAFCELINDEDKLSEFASKNNISNFESFKTLMQARKTEMQKNFYKSKAKCLDNAIDYLAWLGVRTDNRENNFSQKRTTNIR